VTAIVWAAMLAVGAHGQSNLLLEVFTNASQAFAYSLQTVSDGDPFPLPCTQQEGTRGVDRRSCAWTPGLGNGVIRMRGPHVPCSALAVACPCCPHPR
jgi:hypothetical protein